jgi:hypothetical protein
MNFGEQGVAGVTVSLTGADDLGQAVSRTTLTDANGLYSFANLRPSNAAGYTLTETQPPGPLDGKETLGTVNGVAVGSATANDVFSGIVLGVPGGGALGDGYRFGERPATTGSDFTGQAASILFWDGSNGQALINSLNGGPSATQLGNWLAATFPNLYATLAAKTNADVAAFYRTLYALRCTAGPPKAEAQVMAIALSVYVTNQSLAGTTATAYGFQVSTYGLGAKSYTLTNNGGPFGLSGTVAVMDLLLATDIRSRNGQLFDVNGDGRISLLEASYRNTVNNVFLGISTAGGI